MNDKGQLGGRQISSPCNRQVRLARAPLCLALTRHHHPPPMPPRGRKKKAPREPAVSSLAGRHPQTPAQRSSQLQAMDTGPSLTQPDALSAEGEQIVPQDLPSSLPLSHTITEGQTVSPEQLLDDSRDSKSMPTCTTTPPYRCHPLQPRLRA